MRSRINIDIIESIKNIANRLYLLSVYVNRSFVKDISIDTF